MEAINEIPRVTVYYFFKAKIGLFLKGRQQFKWQLNQGSSQKDVSTKVPCYFAVWEPRCDSLSLINKIPIGKKRGGLLWITLAPAEPCYKEYLIALVHPQQWQMTTAWTRSELELRGRSPSLQVHVKSHDLPGAVLLHHIMSESISGILRFHGRWSHLIVLAFPVCCCWCDTVGQAGLHVKSYPGYG